MKVYFKESQPMPSNSRYKENILEICFDEDLFNDPQYAVGGEKYSQLKLECEVAILEHLKKMPLKDAETDVVFPGKICFNLNNVPEVKTGEGIQILDLKTFIAGLAGFSTEKTLGIEIEKKSGRRWFLKRGAPTPVVEASKAKEGVQTLLSKDCWGCYGLMTNLDKAHTRDDVVCKL